LNLAFNLDMGSKRFTFSGMSEASLRLLPPFKDVSLVAISEETETAFI